MAKKSHHTLIHQIYESPNLPPAEKASNRVNDEVQTITGAGLEITATLLRAITCHVYPNEEILRRLRNELPSLNGPSPDWCLRELEHLPYLTAVIKEGLRLNPGVATRWARIAPDRDLYYGTWTVPAGSPVGMTTFLMHQDTTLHPVPEAFDPQRWMDEAWKKMADKTFAPFSRGTRNCIGMRNAWAEPYFTLAMIVARFDLEFAGTEKADVECGSDRFVP